MKHDDRYHPSLLVAVGMTLQYVGGSALLPTKSFGSDSAETASIPAILGKILDPDSARAFPVDFQRDLRIIAP